MSTRLMDTPRFDWHAMRYGAIVSADLVGTPYTEGQCGQCPHGHRCCDLVVQATPAEAAGIVQWLNENTPRADIPALMRAIQLRASVLAEHFKKFGANQTGAIQDWFSKRMRCVFYDHEAKGCSIYPVRPVACRRAFGDGDCADGAGIQCAPDAQDVLTARVARFKIHPDLQNNIGEMTSLVAVLATSREPMQVDSEFYRHDPKDLTEEQVIFGLQGRPTPNPVAMEINDGSTERTERPVPGSGA